MALQNIADHLKRIGRGGYPVHGIAMGQIGKRTSCAIIYLAHACWNSGQERGRE